MTWKSVTMEGTVRLVGLAVALLLTIGCEGAPSHNVEARSILVNPHIVMGKDANIEDIPYQLSIEVLRMHGCGGAIISEDWVITAAHCVYPQISGPTWLKRLRVGSSSSIPIIGWGGEIHQIAEAMYHPQFSLMTVDYDVGVIRVSERFVYSDRIRPIAVPSPENGFVDYSLPAQVSGWGVTDPDAWFTPWHLKVAEIPLVPRERCNELHEVAPGSPKITPRMLCGAGTGKGGPCFGDSGGPLVHKGEVVGLVSWGLKCNDATYPSVFTNLLNNEIRGFVKENTGI